MPSTPALVLVHASELRATAEFGSSINSKTTKAPFGALVEQAIVKESQCDELEYVVAIAARDDENQDAGLLRKYGSTGP